MSSQFLQSIISLFESGNLFLGLGRPQVWDGLDTIQNRSNPLTEHDKNDVLRSTFLYKRVDDVVFLAQKNVWASGLVFDEYSDRTAASCFIYASPNIYKCIGNNGGAQSTDSPVGKSLNTEEYADGYLWKYVGSVVADDLHLVESDFIPVRENEYVLGNPTYIDQESVILSNTLGTIDRVELVSGGAGYHVGTTTIAISGDGIGATAVATVHPLSGIITDITLTNSGSGYTFATVSINDTNPSAGAGAVILPTISPYLGHGSNLVDEMNLSTLLIKAAIVGDVSSNITSDIKFREHVLVNSLRLANDALANGQFYINTLTLTLDGSSFVIGEEVKDADGLSVGFVAMKSPSSLYITNVTNVPSVSDVVYGVSSGSNKTITAIANKPLSNDCVLIEDIQHAQEDKLLNSDQIVTVRFVVTK